MSGKEAFDWASEARRAVGYVSGGKMFAARRGAMRWDHAGVTVVFGNDGLARNPRAKDEVAAVRRFIADRGIKELGFATCPGGYSWAFLLQSEDVDSLNRLLRGVWENPIQWFQKDVARQEIEAGSPKVNVFPN